MAAREQKWGIYEICGICNGISNPFYFNRLPKFRREIWKLVKLGKVKKGLDSGQSDFRTGIHGNTAFRMGTPLGGEDRLRSSGTSGAKHNVATLTGVGMETGVISYAGVLW